MMVQTLIGIVMIGLAGYEVYALRNWFIYTKTHGNQNTSPFILLGLYGGGVFTLVLFAFGMMCLFHYF